MNKNKNIKHAVAEGAAYIRRRLRLCMLSFGVLLVALLFLGQNLLRNQLAFDGRSEFYYLLGGVLFLSFITIWRYFVLSRRYAGQRVLLQRLDSAWPELQQGLTAAWEVEEKLHGKQPGLVEAELLRRMNLELEKRELHSAGRPLWLGPGFVASLACVALIALASVLSLPLLQDVVAEGRDLTASTNTSFEVEPGNTEVVYGESLGIRVKLLRGRGEPRVFHNAGGEWLRVPMSREGDVWVVTLNSLIRDFSYRVLSDTHESATYKVGIYRRPQFASVELKVQPPVYTALPVREMSTPGTYGVPEGSSLDLQVAVEGAKSVELLEEGGGTHALVLSKAGKWQLARTLNQGMRFTVLARSERGLESRSGEFILKVSADEKPLFELIHPKKDMQATLDEDIALKATVADDYGLRQVFLHLSDSQGLEESIPLYTFEKKGENKTFLPIGYEFSLRDYGFKEGDVIAAYYTATDNDEPEANKGRSPIFFIEVRPDLSEYQNEKKEEEKQESEGGGEDLNAVPLILATKAAIRENFDQRMLAKKKPDGTYDLDESRANDLAASLGELSLKISEVRQKGEEKDPNFADGLGRYFEEAEAQVKKAATAVRAKRLGEAVKAEQVALSQIVKADIEIEKMKQKSKSKGKPEQKQDLQDNKKKDEDERRTDTLEKLEELKKEMEDLEEEMDQARTEEQRQQAADKARDMQRKLDQAAQEMQEQSPLAAERLRQAADRMQDAAEKMEKNQREEAFNETAEASQDVSESMENLRREERGGLRQQASNLAEKMNELAKQQAKLNEKALGKKKGSKAEDAALQAEQKKLREELAKQDQALAELANKAAEGSPEAAEKLQELRQELTQRGAERRMEKAEKALNYGLRSRAAKEMKKAEQAVNELAEGVKQAAKGLEQLDQQQLMEMRELVENRRRAMNSAASDSEKAREARRSEALLEEVAKALGDEELQGEMQEMAQAAKSGEGQQPGEGKDAGQQPGEGKGEGQQPGEGKGEGQQPGEGKGEGQQPGEGKGQQPGEGKGEGKGQQPGRGGETSTQGAGKASGGTGKISVGANGRVKNVLDKAAQKLDALLEQKLLAERMRRQNPGTEVPDEYYRQVREYLKRLNESKKNKEKNK